MSFAPYKPREPGSTPALVSALFSDAGGVERAAFLLGISRTQAYAATDSGPDGRPLPLDQARRLAAMSGSVVLAEDAAALAGGFFMPAADPAANFSDLAGLSAQTFGIFTSAVMTALSDGALTAKEKAGLLEQLNILLPQLAAARAKLMAGQI